MRPVPPRREANAHNVAGVGPRVVGIIVVVAALIGGGVFAGLELASDNGSSDAGPAPGSRRPPEVEATSTTAPDSTTTSFTGPPPPLADVRVQAVQVATADQPLDLTTRPGDEALYVAEKTGRVLALHPAGEPTVVLDISSEVSEGSEQGLLGIDFTSDGSFLYANYTDLDGHTRVVEWAMQGDRANAESRRDVLKVEQPYSNHNGGVVKFGPDGFLYVGLGDGGAGGDPEGRAQDLSTLLGKILRIHPRPTENSPYAVPSSNPFLSQQGARGEVWAYGLRNPWRLSFDRLTGDLWIGDVGQDAVEEVDYQPASATGGANYGWDRLEGSTRFEGDPPAQHVLPIHEYPNARGGCAVTGGYVYRGERIPALFGAYVFADFCAGELMALRQDGGVTTEVASLGVTLSNVASFGEDDDGELYVLSLAGGVYRLEPAG